jgi:DNA-binding HxlR family transcriptional regulator
LDIEISYCKDKLKEISMKYNSTMICEWSTLREKELYFYRELSKLQMLKKNKEATIEHLETKNNMVILVENKPEEINDKERQNDEDEQWEINEKILSDSFKEKEEEEFINEAIKEIFYYDASEQLKDFMDSLDDEGIHNLDNATEAMEIVFGKSKRARYGESSIKMKERWKDHLEYLKIGLQKKTTIHTIIYQVNMHTWE